MDKMSTLKVEETYKIPLVWGKRCVGNCPSQAPGNDVLLKFPAIVNIVDPNVTTLLTNTKKL